MPENNGNSLPIDGDSLRRQVAEVIGISAQEISLDDDLSDHGLSSLNLVTLLEQWSDDGIEIDIADFLAEPKLSLILARSL